MPPSPDAQRDALAEVGAAIDVYHAEPYTDSPLCDLPNAILTLRTAPCAQENIACMNVAAAQNVIDFFNKREKA